MRRDESETGRSDDMFGTNVPRRRFSLLRYIIWEWERPLSRLGWVHLRVPFINDVLLGARGWIPCFLSAFITGFRFTRVTIYYVHPPGRPPGSDAGLVDPPMFCFFNKAILNS